MRERALEGKRERVRMWVRVCWLRVGGCKGACVCLLHPSLKHLKLQRLTSKAWSTLHQSNPEILFDILRITFWELHSLARSPPFFQFSEKKRLK